MDVDGYRAEMERHKEISRGTGERGLAQRAADFARDAGFASEFVGYTKVDVLTQIGALEELGDGTFLAKLRETPFYPAGGGQVTDQGWIERDDDPSVRAELVDAFRFDGDQALLFRGDGFAAGDRVRAVVPWSVRFPTMANHTATHLLQAALREVLGDHVKQAGSAVRPDKLRFDFTHTSQLTRDERDAIEERVNRAVFANLPVHTFETTLDEARRLGAMALFGEKYGEVVRVVDVPGTTTELCGGTHVRSTAEIGGFAILSEGSVGGGARRIEAVTSGEAWATLHARAGEADDLRAELEEARKERKRKAASSERAADPDAQVVAVDGVNVVVQAVDGFEGDALLELSDRIKQRHAPAAVVLGSAARRKRQPRRELRRGGRRAGQRLGRDQGRGAARRRRRRRPADDGAGGRQGRRQAAGRARRGRAPDSRRALTDEGRRARLRLPRGPAWPSPTRPGRSRVPSASSRRPRRPRGSTASSPLVGEHDAELVVVGLPLTLRGERGEQARATEAFVEALRARLAIPVETYDERFTTTLAQQSGGRAPEDAVAAAHLLQGWLERPR